MSNAITIANSNQPLIPWTAPQINVLRTELFPDLNDTQFALFAQVCRRTGLDPFAKQIYAMILNGRLVIFASIDGLRLCAQRSQRYDGLAARVGVRMQGVSEPTIATATWREFAKDVTKPVGRTWKAMPSIMLAKCAEAQALRKAFPAELSGVYAIEELDLRPDTSTPRISDEQQIALSAKLVEGGFSQEVADAHAAQVPASKFDEAMQRAERRIAEAQAAAATPADDEDVQGELVPEAAA